MARQRAISRLLEALRILRLTEDVRFFHASTSELFGNAKKSPQNEATPFAPRSPYAAAKLYAHWITVNYREAYGMHASNGILFNHESATRGETSVTRKITRSVAAIAHGLQDHFFLGNLNAKRDWGHARDYVDGIWRIVSHDSPDDYVLATGEAHSVREFVELAFKEVAVDIVWEGEGVNEKGRCARTGMVRVMVDPHYYRPTEVHRLVGEVSKAREVLGWMPKSTFPDIVSEMVEQDLATVPAERGRR